MNSITKILSTLLLMAAVMGYTIYNYITGKIDTTYLLVFVVILGIPFVNIINILIRDWKNK